MSCLIKFDILNIRYILSQLRFLNSDLSKSDPARKTKPIGEGVTLLAELDIKGSGGMEQLMSAAGLKETILPIGGTLSPQVFDVKLPKEQRLKGDVTLHGPAEPLYTGHSF